MTEAGRFVEEIYRERLRRRGRSSAHPRAAAALLAADHQHETVVIAGLLHDALEDCDVSAGELCERFGAEVARLVEAVTQDSRIGRYRDRKAALRAKTLEAGRDAATIALADKLAKVNDAADAPRPRKLAHYRATLEGIEARYGPTRLSRALRTALARWP